MVISIRARAARALTAVKINFAPKQRLPKAVISPMEMAFYVRAWGDSNTRPRIGNPQLQSNAEARLGNTADFFGNRAKLQCPWRPSSSATVAADFRAPTPSAAAELIVPDINDLQRGIDGCTRALARQLLNRVRDAQQRLDHARETLQRCLAHKLDSYKRGLLHIARALQARSPRRELMVRRDRFADLHRRLVACPSRLLENARHRFQHMEGILRVLGPDATLRRGYSITTNERGKIIRTIAAVRPKMKIRTLFVLIPSLKTSLIPFSYSGGK